jgi:mannose-6-phosphate isomerase-like protein (cupin superfamily)
MARQFRRVVTGHNSEGKSIILMDGAPPQVSEPMPQVFTHEIWETSSPADNTGNTDTAIREPRIEPHDPAGTIFRYVEFPPDEVLQDVDVADAFAQMGSSGAHDSESKVAGMHETQTTDYAIVLEGEMWAVMEEGETKLSANEVLIQRGTNHAWSNRSGKPALMLFILIGAHQRT